MCKRTGLALLAAFALTALLGELSAEAESPQDPSTDSLDQQAMIWENLNWLAGRWEGEAFGGRCEEVWSQESGGSMTGSFKLVVDGRVGFYELMVITIDSCGPILRLKHFNADLTGWEEKDKVIEFECDGYTANELRFSGLVYRRVGESQLQIVLSTKADDGTVSEHLINCRRVD